MSAPAVTIIVPCYNGAAYVRETLLSVIGQTISNWECIVIDDGSTDNSAEEIKSIEDDRIKYIYQPNKGLSEARNTGLKHARGEFVQLLDADDTLFPTKLEKQLAFLSHHPEYDLVAGGFVRIDEQGNHLFTSQLPEGEIELRDILLENRWMVATPLFRRNISERVGLFEPGLRAAEDWDYWCRIALTGGRCYMRNEALNTYRKTETAMTTNVKRQTEMLLRVVDRSFSHPNLPQELEDDAPAAWARTLLNGSARAVALEKYDLAASYLSEALKFDLTIQGLGYERFLRRLARMIENHQSPDGINLIREFFTRYAEEIPGLNRSFRKAILHHDLIHSSSKFRVLVGYFLRNPVFALHDFSQIARFQLAKFR